jgi:hypothetical protein
MLRNEATQSSNWLRGFYYSHGPGRSGTSDLKRVSLTTQQPKYGRMTLLLDGWRDLPELPYWNA